LQNLVELARTVCQQPVTAINIITADLQYQVAAVGMEPYLCSREDSMCAVSFLGGRPTVVEDASLDPRYSGNPYVDGRRGAVRFYASIPLVAEDGFVLGTLCAGAREPGRLSDRQRHGLEILAAEIVDVLHLERRARQLSDALGEARRANALLAEFAGRISHDLRNPLTSVLGYVELGQMSDGAASYATTGGDLRPARVSLKDLVQDVVQDLAASLEVSGAAVDAGDLIFTADAGQMRVLLQNLIHNAVTYSRPGIAPVVRVTGHVSEGGVTLRVIDNGKGISEPDRDRVLDPLVRLHRDGDPPGTGLGLATCARIASAAGGRLEIGPVPGEGTMISIHLQQES
jgi:signal transduction histidine kinase